MLTEVSTTHARALLRCGTAAAGTAAEQRLHRRRGPAPCSLLGASCCSRRLRPAPCCHLLVQSPSRGSALGAWPLAAVRAGGGTEWPRVDRSTQVPPAAAPTCNWGAACAAPVMRDGLSWPACSCCGSSCQAGMTWLSTGGEAALQPPVPPSPPLQPSHRDTRGQRDTEQRVPVACAAGGPCDSAAQGQQCGISAAAAAVAAAAAAAWAGRGAVGDGKCWPLQGCSLLNVCSYQPLVTAFN